MSPCLLFFRRYKVFFEAIFQPQEQAEYNDEAKELIGKRIALQDGWILKDGPYKGQQCFYVPGTHVGVIPLSHLEGIKDIPFVKWEDLRIKVCDLIS